MKELPHTTKNKQRKRQSLRYTKLSERSAIQDTHSFEISAHIQHTERKSNENLSFSPQKQKGQYK